MSDTKQVVYGSSEVAIIESQKLYKLGWELDEDNPPNFTGFSMVVNYVLKEGVDKPKMTREEIAAKARAAKAAKKAQEGK